MPTGKKVPNEVKKKKFAIRPMATTTTVVSYTYSCRTPLPAIQNVMLNYLNVRSINCSWKKDEHGGWLFGDNFEKKNAKKTT